MGALLVPCVRLCIGGAARDAKLVSASASPSVRIFHPFCALTLVLLAPPTTSRILDFIVCAADFSCACSLRSALDGGAAARLESQNSRWRRTRLSPSCFLLLDSRPPRAAHHAHSSSSLSRGRPIVRVRAHCTARTTVVWRRVSSCKTRGCVAIASSPSCFPLLDTCPPRAAHHAALSRIHLSNEPFFECALRALRSRRRCGGAPRLAKLMSVSPPPSPLSLGIMPPPSRVDIRPPRAAHHAARARVRSEYSLPFACALLAPCALRWCGGAPRDAKPVAAPRSPRASRLPRLAMGVTSLDLELSWQ